MRLMAASGRVGLLGRHLLLALAVAAGTAAAPLPAAAEEAWEGLLRQQLLKERDCRMEKITAQREVKVGEHTVLEGRIRCVDSREFDFSREQPHLPFKLQLCSPIYC